MADQLSVRPFGQAEFTITSGDSITVVTTGDGYFVLSEQLGYPNLPSQWSQVARVEGTGTYTYGPYTSDLNFKIEAGSSPVYYSYGATLADGALENPYQTPFFPNPVVGNIIEYWEDFLDAGTLPADPSSDTIDWNFTVTEAGGGDAVLALQDTQGGVMKITNDGNDNDKVVAAKEGENFLFVAGKKTWFRAKFAVSDIDDVDAFMGLVIQTATDPAGTAPTDGVWFQLLESDGDGGLTFVVSKDSTQTTQAVATMVNDTMIDVAFYYNGVDSFEVYADDTWIASVAVTNLPDDEELSVFFAIQNGAAENDYMLIDYIYVAQERS